LPNEWLKVEFNTFADSMREHPPGFKQKAPEIARSQGLFFWATPVYLQELNLKDVIRVLQLKEPVAR
jgi:hypothetical protein